MRAYAHQQHVMAADAARALGSAMCFVPAGSWTVIPAGAPTSSRKHGRPRRTSVSTP